MIAVDWSVIVVGDSSVKPSPGAQVVPGGRKGGDGKMEGGWSLTQTEESLYWCGGITTGAYWHDHAGSVVSSGQRDTEG